MRCPDCEEEVEEGALCCSKCEAVVVTEAQAEATLKSLDGDAVKAAILSGADSVRKAILEVWTRQHREAEYDLIVEFLGLSHADAVETVIPEADVYWRTLDDMEISWDVANDILGGIGRLEIGDAIVQFSTGDPDGERGYEFEVLSISRQFSEEQEELLTALDQSLMLEIAVSGSDTSLQDVIETVARAHLIAEGVTEDDARAVISRLWATGEYVDILDACFPDATVAVRIELEPEFAEGDEGFTPESTSFEAPYYVDPGGSSEIEATIWEIECDGRGCSFTMEYPSWDDPRAARGAFPIHARWTSPDERMQARVTTARAVLLESAGAASSFDDMRGATPTGYFLVTSGGDEELARTLVAELDLTILEAPPEQ